MLVGSLIARGNVEKYKEIHNLSHIPTWAPLVLEQETTHESTRTILSGSLIYYIKLYFSSMMITLYKEDVTKIMFSMFCIRRQKVSNILF